MLKSHIFELHKVDVIVLYAISAVVKKDLETLGFNGIWTMASAVPVLYQLSCQAFF